MIGVISSPKRQKPLSKSVSGKLVTFRDTEGNVLSALEAERDNPFAGGPRQ